MRKIFVAAVCAVAFSACGGGGGSAPGGSLAPGGTGATPTPSSIQTTSVQRADAAEALTSYSGTALVAQYGLGGTSIASVRRSIDAAAVRVTEAYRQGYRAPRSTSPRQTQSVAYSACANGFESAQVNVSPSEVQIYDRVFYDAACTKLYEDLFIDATASSQTAIGATGTATYYNTAGTVYDYKTITLTLTGIGTGAGSFSIIGKDAPSASAAPTASLGVACNVATNSLGCGIAAIASESALSQDLGALMGFTTSASTSANGNVTVPITGSASAYTGALGALSLAQGTFPNFTISGGSLAQSGTFNGTFTFASTGVLVSGSFTLTDSATDGTVTVASSGTPATSVSGTIKRTSTGQVVATFTTDGAGNGTITYGNGTTAQIVNWQIFG
jgi:hypothetical protein